MSLAKTSDLDQAAREFERETAEDGEEEEEELGMEEPSEEEDSASDLSESIENSDAESENDGETPLPSSRATFKTIPPSASGFAAQVSMQPTSLTDVRKINGSDSKTLSGEPITRRKQPKSYTVDVACGLPHPAPTHAIAASQDFSHLITGSEDGFIRDYDVFAGLNGKTYLTATQRHHCGVGGVVDGLMKAGSLRFWWENSDMSQLSEIQPLSNHMPVAAAYSLLMHSQALWALCGTNKGHINLFTVRHEPGRLCHVIRGHRGPVSALALSHDEKGFYSGGWDGCTIQWDLNTGQTVRNFNGHGAQLVTVALRPDRSNLIYSHPKSPKFHAPTHTAEGRPATESLPSNPAQFSETRSEASYDPLFDDEPDAENDYDKSHTSITALPAARQSDGKQFKPLESIHNSSRHLEPSVYAQFSSDVLMTATIDGQILLWDRRTNAQNGVGRLWTHEKTPPWCVSACWSANGAQIYAGRRNGTVDTYDVRQLGETSQPRRNPRLLKSLRNPASSGVVSCVVAFPDGRHIACASSDNIRLWNVAEAGEPDAFGKVKNDEYDYDFPSYWLNTNKLLPVIDSEGKFLVSASSNRGWHGESTRAVFVHEVKCVY